MQELYQKYGSSTDRTTQVTSALVTLYTDIPLQGKKRRLKINQVPVIIDEGQGDPEMKEETKVQYTRS